MPLARWPVPVQGVIAEAVSPKEAVRPTQLRRHVVLQPPRQRRRRGEMSASPRPRHGVADDGPAAGRAHGWRGGCHEEKGREEEHAGRLVPLHCVCGGWSLGN